MRRYVLTAWLICMVLTYEHRVFGAEMSEPEGPSFAIGSDTILSGDEPEFAKCKALQSEYLGSLSAKVEAIVYAHSSVWGYVIRVLYASRHDAQKRPEMGTLICWCAPPSGKTNFLVDVAGTADDLKKVP